MKVTESAQITKLGVGVTASKFPDPANPAFHVIAPAEQRVPYIFNSPHSGRMYPRSLHDVSRLSPIQLRRSEDVLVDQLFASVVEIGAPLLVAEFARAWLDVNREPFELDPQLFKEKLPAYANTHSMRVLGGLGTIPRLVAEGVPIYASPPTLEEGLERIENIYRPYHETLRSLMEQSVARFGHGVLVDCHSMPASGTRRGDKTRPDIVIGDRYGTSCRSQITHELVRLFTEFGYAVATNKPYAGGFITEHYGKPMQGVHAVQIEINRGLYVNEQTLQPTSGFRRLSEDIRHIMALLVSMPDGEFSPHAVAAE